MMSTQFETAISIFGQNGGVCSRYSEYGEKARTVRKWARGVRGPTRRGVNPWGTPRSWGGT